MLLRKHGILHKALVQSLFYRRTSGLMLLGCLCGGVVACKPAAPEPYLLEAPLVINEVVSNNDGVWIDEQGEADDFIEVLNRDEAAVDLSQYALSDKLDVSHPLPKRIVAPGETVLLWADGNPEQGPHHLPFKLSSKGGTVWLWRSGDRPVGQVPFPALDANASFARKTQAGAPLIEFEICRYPTPARNNTLCAAPPAPELPDDVQFAPFVWPKVWPPTPQPLALGEISLRPLVAVDAFIEVHNTSTQTVDVSGFSVRIATHKPGQTWPASQQGAQPTWAVQQLLPGARAVLPVAQAHVAALVADPLYEGVVTLFKDKEAIDRVDFMHWPAGAVLTRDDNTQRFRFCTTSSPGAANQDCLPLPSRPVGDRLRGLHTPGDFAALAAGGTALSQRAVKFVVDLEGGGAVHLLSAQAWPLHYNFVRTLIDGDEPLNLCVAAENTRFRAGWVAFSQREYFQAEGRRYLLGTLVSHAGSDVRSMEFAVGDAISAAQMKQAYFAVAGTLPDPERWAVRPQAAEQVATVRQVEGQMPAVGPNVPYRGLTYQPLAAAVGFGVLRFVPAAALPQTTLDPRTILVTDDVPNDIELVGGLVTEAFQTPLAHVNILSTGRGTPNMALKAARRDARIMALMGKPVRLEVHAEGFDLREATVQELETYWQTHFGSKGGLTAKLDLTERRLRPLKEMSLDDIPRIGAKAAQLAELGRVRSANSACPGGMGVPVNSFAVPVVHSLEHSASSGAANLIDALLADASLRQDVEKRAARLDAIRAAIAKHPVSPSLRKQLEAQIAGAFRNGRVRLRSSSNAEDLSDFNGAGLYQSVAVALDDPERDVSQGLRTVWASLWTPRAFAERELAGIDHKSVGMGIVVHEAFPSEEVNGVAVSRNVLDPADGDIFYINAQRGEASVTNPAPGITTEQLLYRWFGSPPVLNQSRSTFSPEEPVMSPQEVELLACRLDVLSKHFRTRLDPMGAQPWFAMEVEFKLVDPNARRLIIKQARPYSFGRAEIPADCRERL